jgi:GDP-4-dehydro-6-deoxy-D-mannose reductase
MRALITGVRGFAGRHLARTCAAEGAVAIGLARRALDDPELQAELEEYVRCDLAHPTQAQAAIASALPDVVFHLAAEASVSASWKDPQGTIERNLATTVNLLEAVRLEAPRARVLIAGSGEEYGVQDDLPMTEAHVLRPQNPYAVSKAASGLTAGFYHDAHGLHVVRVRAFNHAGPGQSDVYVVSNFARQIAEAEAGSRDTLEIRTGNVAVRRDFTDVRDVARAYWLALTAAPPGVYNVCSGRSISISEILDGLATHASIELSPVTDPNLLREHEVMEIRGSHEKLKRATGWEPRIPLERTLADTLDWWREQVAGAKATAGSVSAP